MNPTRMRDLDEVIEDALKSEPLRTVPAEFHLRVLERVQGTAMEDAEQRGRQFRFAASVLVFMALGASLFAVPFFSFFVAWLGGILPGGMGYFTQIIMVLMKSHALLLTTIVACSTLAVVSLALAVGLYAVRYRRSHGYRAI
ncbi:MAG: hypothetical protein K1Y02_18695 [Candidatus Hydrogenedentes bacterium]|nr:hypothetical protein [Candidatus Hydrogenedentota bacterium]